MAASTGCAGANSPSAGALRKVSGGVGGEPHFLLLPVCSSASPAGPPH